MGPPKRYSGKYEGKSKKRKKEDEDTWAYEEDDTNESEGAVVPGAAGRNAENNDRSHFNTYIRKTIICFNPRN